MRILFIVQGEGRGHLTQAITMEAMLRRNGHEVVEVLVGKSGARSLPDFFSRSMNTEIKLFDSPNFLPTPSNKRSNLTRSVAYNIFKIPTYLKSILFIRRRIEQTKADLVINFYELLTGLTYLLFRPQVPQVSIGHQYLFLHDGFEFPKGSPVSLFFLRMFTRITCIGAQDKLALSFRNMPDDRKSGVSVVPPLLRRDVLDTKAVAGDYLHGYMVNAGFGESINRWHRNHSDVPLNFFWDKKGVGKVYKVDRNLTFNQIDDKAFLKSLAGCRAYATTAGFESVCEAMYLGKPILMVPAHIEQDCNAYDASRCGAGIVCHDFDLGRLLDFSSKYAPDPEFRHWVSCCSVRMMSHIEHAATMVPEHHMSLSFLFSLLPSRFVGA